MDKHEIVKRLEYCAENKCDICQKENGSGFPLIDGRCYGFTERLYDAIALLKAQEPHVLALEQACGRDYCFYEYRATGYVEPASVVLSGMLLNGTLPLVEVYRLGRENAALVAANGYGHEWRCWGRMPEDGQKEEEPWDN